jgi:hypothetical protein
MRFEIGGRRGFVEGTTRKQGREGNGKKKHYSSF